MPFLEVGSDVSSMSLSSGILELGSIWFLLTFSLPFPRELDLSVPLDISGLLDLIGPPLPSLFLDEERSVLLFLGTDLFDEDAEGLVEVFLILFMLQHMQY